MIFKAIAKIPRGQVRTYKELAKLIKKPKAARAVANACGKNPYAPKIPCHRAIRADGGLGGYSGKGGIKAKIKLLKSEKSVFFSSKKVVGGVCCLGFLCE